MGFGARIEDFEGVLADVAFHWDPETEILSGAIPTDGNGRGFTGSIELEDAKGAVITLDVQSGDLAGIDVVVWPRTKVVEDLAPPRPKRAVRLRVPSRPSQPGVGVVEIDTTIAAERSADEAVIHLRFGPGRRSEVAHLARNVLLELDARGEAIGFWLMDVPKFPAGESSL